MSFSTSCYTPPMLTLYHAPMTRSLRVRWLLEELALPHELKRVPFVPPGAGFFAQATPGGKFPVLVDGDITIGESGAIVEYVLERYGNGRLAPAIGTPLRGPFLQWLHFAESTAFQPLNVFVWHARYKGDADQLPTVMEDARTRAQTTFAVIERALDGHDFLLGSEFSAADIMMGYTGLAAFGLGALGEGFPNLQAYLGRLQTRPAFQRAFAD